MKRTPLHATAAEDVVAVKAEEALKTMRHWSRGTRQPRLRCEARAMSGPWMLA